MKEKETRHNLGNYTEAEIKTLKDDSLTDYEVAALLNRSYDSIHQKRHRMKPKLP